MESPQEILQAVASVLSDFPEVLFAYVFGSAMTGRLRSDSDIDVAIYGGSEGYLEVESTRELAREPQIQLALERATNRNIDLLVLNRAPATVCAAAVTGGQPALIRDDSLRIRYFLAVTSVATDFQETEAEFREVRERSRSLIDTDRTRLLRIIDYVIQELQDRETFGSVDLERYRSDRDVRRSIDRWAEMLINAAIDIAKIILAAERRPVPQTYAQILSDLSTIDQFGDLGGRLAPLAGLRNLLAHEYLDLRFTRVKRFADTGADAVADLMDAVRLYLET